MKFRHLIILGSMLWGSASTCHADIIIDGDHTHVINHAFFAPIGQSFTADAPQVFFIGMYTSICGVCGPINFRLNLLNGSGVSGTLVATRTATNPGGAGFVYFDFDGTPLTVGNSYTAAFSQITPSPPSMGPGGAQVDLTGDVYSGGTAFYSDFGQGLAQARPGEDFLLRVLSTTDEIPVAIPTSSALALLGLGLAGLGFSRRRQDLSLQAGLAPQN